MESKLRMAQFHITNRCNLNCIFCGVRKFPKLGELTNKKWIDILDNVIKMSPIEITISGGGEPLVRIPLLKHMIKEVKKHGIRGTLITNGTIFDDELIKEMVSNGWDEVRISLHSPSEELDYSIRGYRDAFQKSIQFIQKINDYKIEKNLRKPLICLWYVISKLNWQYLEDFVNFGIKLNADEIKFRLVNEGEVKEKLSLDNNQLAEVRKKILEIKRAYSPHVNISCMFSTEDRNEDRESGRKFTERKKCMLPFYEMIIFADGRVSPCCNFIDVFDKDVIDTIINKSITDIWDGEVFNKFREGSINNINKCKECTTDMIFLNEHYRK